MRIILIDVSASLKAGYWPGAPREKKAWDEVLRELQKSSKVAQKPSVTSPGETY